MKRIKRRLFYGSICDQEIYTVGDQKEVKKNMQIRPRFLSEEERAQHRDHIARVRFLRRFMATFNPRSLYSTLTFDMEDEIHTVWEAHMIRRQLLRWIRKKYPNAQVVIVYGFGKHTHRIHFHMVSNGITKEQIEELWVYGTNLRIVHLREHNFYDGEDRGQDYTGLANYLFNHWTPEIGGHRYHATRNLNEPDEPDEPTVPKRKYSAEKPPSAPPGYKLVEVKCTTYGYQLFRYVWDVENQPLPEPRKRKRG